MLPQAATTDAFPSARSARWGRARASGGDLCRRQKRRPNRQARRHRVADTMPEGVAACFFVYENTAGNIRTPESEKVCHRIYKTDIPVG